MGSAIGRIVRLRQGPGDWFEKTRGRALWRESLGQKLLGCVRVRAAARGQSLRPPRRRDEP